MSVSEFRIEKERVAAVLTLSTGDSAAGSFFVAAASARLDGRESVGELLNNEPGFFPFEIEDVARTRTVLYNRQHVILVALAENEAKRDPGYHVATRRLVSLLMSNGQRLTGAIRVYCREGHDRVSDWARQANPFQYVETPDMTLLVNVTHVIELTEITES